MLVELGLRQQLLSCELICVFSFGLLREELVAADLHDLVELHLTADVLVHVERAGAALGPLLFLSCGAVVYELLELVNVILIDASSGLEEWLC